MLRSRSSSLPAPANSRSIRRGIIPRGGSEQFNRYKILKRRQNRLANTTAARSSRQTNSDGENSSNSDHSLEADPDLEIQKVVTLVRSLANELYLPLKEKHATNLVFSPLGFCISAVMLKMGCCGVANKELTRALFPAESLCAAAAGGDGGKGEETCSEMVIGLQALLHELKENPQLSYTLKQANKVYYAPSQQQKCGIKQSFKNGVKAIYSGVELEELDFQNEGWDQVTALVNKWAHSAGGKMLGDMLTRRTLNNKMIFVNPIYFEGSWLHPFHPEMTQEMKFFLNEKEFASVPMMRSGLLKNLLYFPMNKLACRALVLPFKGERLCFVIFLPNEKPGLSKIETELENICPAEYFQGMNDFRKKLSPQAGLHVSIPKFNIDCTIDYESPMKEMGIETVFEPGKADFSNMIRSSGSNDFSVTQILQKVVIAVNEIGTAKPPRRFSESLEGTRNALEKAKLDGNKTEEGAAADSEIIEFCVDHPFYFQVVDMRSDLIVLAGSCKNPLHGKDLGFSEFLEKYDIQVNPKPEPTPGSIKSHGKL